MDEGKTNYLGIVSCDTHDAIGEFYVMLYVTKESERRGISNFTNKSFYDLQMENVEVVGNIFDNKGMFRDSDEEHHALVFGGLTYDQKRTGESTLP